MINYHVQISAVDSYFINTNISIVISSISISAVDGYFINTNISSLQIATSSIPISAVDSYFNNNKIKRELATSPTPI